ncbi:MAG TPA: CBS domain-containing protein [Lachnospiraceae bacterium]|nr:CBS domain-containing protein [Lachnospiraceae bacterium]
MNILFFLTPKSEVEFVYNDDTISSVMEILEKSTYTAIPVISRTGQYRGSVSEGDILWAVKNDYNFDETGFSKVHLSKITKKIKYSPVKVDEKVDNMIDRVINQNFVPVIDDDEVFIGIVKRKDVLQYYIGQAKKEV